MDALFRIRRRPEGLLVERDAAIARVRAVVPEAEVFEVGSTAVEGAIGKEDIDLLVRVPAADFAHARACLDAAFARNEDQLSNEGYQGYLVDSRFDVALQLTVTGGPYDRFLDFLEALRDEPMLLDAYNDLKRAWDGKPMAEYRRAKARFIEETLARRGGE